MVALLAVALAGTLAVLCWVVVLRRRIRLSEERFRHLAQHDTLTGLATRLVLQDRLNVALESSKRHHTGLAVLMLDLEKFKEINGTFGHRSGDEVLRATANRLSDAVRKSDAVARIGGDEFVILLPELEVPNVESIAAKLVLVVSVPIQFESHSVPGNPLPGPCRTSRRQRSNTLGLTSNSPATSTGSPPASSLRTAASLNSLVNCRRENPMPHFSLLLDFES